MRYVTTPVGLALALFCVLAMPRAAKAADAEVRYIVTIGGADVGGHTLVDFYPNGNHDGLTVASGKAAHIPASTDGIHIDTAWRQIG